MPNHIPSFDKQQASEFAKALRGFVTSHGGTATHLESLDFLAHRLGFNGHHALCASLKKAPMASNASCQAEQHPIYLTNGCCEATDHADEALFATLGLQSGLWQGSFYPLTDSEAR